MPMARTGNGDQCAEALPWRCHRSLIADALVTAWLGGQAYLSQVKADEHRLTHFAVIDGTHSRLSSTSRSTDPPDSSDLMCTCGCRPDPVLACRFVLFVIFGGCCAEVAVDRMAPPAGGCRARSSNSPAGSVRSLHLRNWLREQGGETSYRPTSSHSICCRCSTPGSDTRPSVAVRHRGGRPQSRLLVALATQTHRESRNR